MIAVNISLEDLERRMRSKRMWKFVPQVGRKSNEWMDVSHDPGFRYVHQKGIDGGPWALHEPGGTKHGRRWQKIESLPPTCLRWRSDRSVDSASSREIQIILKTLVSTASSWARCEWGKEPAQSGEQHSIKLRIRVQVYDIYFNAYCLMRKKPN